MHRKSIMASPTSLPTSRHRSSPEGAMIAVWARDKRVRGTCGVEIRVVTAPWQLNDEAVDAAAGIIDLSHLTRGGR